MTKLCGIYLLTHIESGRKYVGQSIDIHKRWREHSRGKSGTHLGNTITKHGWSAFSAEILELCEYEMLNEAEVRHIAHHNCISPNGFNLATGGGHSLHNQESIAKMSESQKGVLHTPETKAKIAAASKARMTEDEKLHLSKTLKGRQRSVDAISKTAATHRGMKRSDEAKAKMAAAKIGVPQSPEHIAARLETRRLHPPKKPHPFSPEHRANIAKGGMGRKFSIETIEKRKETRRKNQLLRQNAAISTGSDSRPEHIEWQ